MVAKILVIQLIIVVVVGTGWVKNIFKLADCDFQSPYKAEFVHAIGLFPPAGAITGWLDVGK